MFVHPKRWQKFKETRRWRESSIQGPASGCLCYWHNPFPRSAHHAPLADGTVAWRYIGKGSRRPWHPSDSQELLVEVSPRIALRSRFGRNQARIEIEDSCQTWRTKRIRQSHPLFRRDWIVGTGSHRQESCTAPATIRPVFDSAKAWGKTSGVITLPVQDQGMGGDMTLA